ncbi:MAG: hypothetical protein ACHQVS_02240 [Candidatus Babeliales bacterium]
MHKKIVGCLLIAGVMGIHGAGMKAPSFTLINGVVKDEEDALIRPTAVEVTYELLDKAITLRYISKSCHLVVPLTHEGKTVTRIRVTEYNTHHVERAYDYHEFIAEERNILASGKKGLSVKESDKKHRDHKKRLSFALEDLKSATAACKKDGG